MIRATVKGLTDYLHAVYVPSRLDISAGAVRQIAVACRQLEAFAGRALLPADLTEDLIRQFLADFRASRSAATTNSRRRDLLAIWQSGFDLGWCRTPPRRKRIPTARQYGDLPRAWSIDEVSRILAAAAGDRWPIAGLPAREWWLSFLLVAYDTGERRGAILHVSPRDIDYDHRCILFRRTKTGRQRWCRLHSDTLAACQRFCDPLRAKMWPWPYTDNGLEKRFKRILDRAQVWHPPGRLFRLLRITSGTLVEQAGGPGHTHLGNSREVFERHYRDARFVPDTLRFLPRPELPSGNT